jgi:hypothetical protein
VEGIGGAQRHAPPEAHQQALGLAVGFRAEVRAAKLAVGQVAQHPLVE